ncbi:MAG: hypothetical protein LBG24_09355 [Treponema sp.]|jgi:hypothetical protein|nr:hypothetical protein [Treponema sp.]
MTSEKPRIGPTSNQPEAHEVTQELDTYGVWVKSEPQIISESIPDISHTLNFPDERAAPDEAGSKPAGTIALESWEPEGSAGPRDFIRSARQEKEDGISSTGKSAHEVSMDDRAVGPGAHNDAVGDDLYEQIAIEELLAAPVPLLDSGAPQNEDAGLSKKEVPIPAVPEPPPEEAYPGAFMQSPDSPEGLHLLKNILEELSLIRHEVSALKELVLRQERAAETLEFKKEDAAEEGDEKVTITGDELTNIFHNAGPIPKAVTPTHTAPFAQGIEVIQTDEEPPETEYGIRIDFTESEPLQDAERVADALPDTAEMRKEDTEEGSLQDDTSGNLVHSDTYDETLSGEAPENTWLKDGDGRDRDASPVLPADSADPVMADFLLDDLFIENGSIKGIPLALNPDDEEEMDDAFETIESLIGPEDTAVLHKAGNPDDGEPPDDTPPFDGIGRGSAPGGSGTGYPSPQEQEPHNQDSQESSAFSPETSLHRPFNLKEEIKNILVFMDQLLEALPEDKIGEFAESRYFDIYKKLFSTLGIA